MNKEERKNAIEQATKNYYRLEERSIERSRVAKNLALQLGIEQDQARKMINNTYRKFKVDSKSESDNEEEDDIIARLESLPTTKIYNCHVYHKSKISVPSKSAYYYCSCSCSLIITLNGEEHIIKTSGEHKLSCKIVTVEKQEEKNIEIAVHCKICELCKDKTLTFSQIFDDLIGWFKSKYDPTKTNSRIWKFIDEGRLRQLFRLYRHIDVPEFNKNITSLSNDFQPVVCIKPHVLAFQSKEMYEKMKDIEILLIDGTFEATPLPFYQTINFMGLTSQKHRFINILHILNDGKSENDYDIAFNVCRFLLTNLNPKIIVTDYEKALKNSLLKIFPEKLDTESGVIYINCYFHYCYILKRKFVALYGAKETKSKTLRRFVYKMALHFPFVPLESKKEYIKLITTNDNDCKDFVKYFMDNWGCKDLEQWANQNEEERIITQCAIEGFHHLLNDEFSRKPSLEEFASALFKLDKHLLNLNEMGEMLGSEFTSKAKTNGDHVALFEIFKKEYYEILNEK